MSIFMPDYRFDRISDIGRDWLIRLQIRALLLDVDNTLAPHGSPEIADDIREWCAEMTASGIRMVIVSNNRARRVGPFAGKLDIPYIANACKPLSFGIRRAVREFGLERAYIAMVGDQLFTDVAGGNLAGLTTILVEPMAQDDGALLKLKRGMERRLMQR